MLIKHEQNMSVTKTSYTEDCH